jgi:hypothetical protein
MEEVIMHVRRGKHEIVRTPMILALAIIVAGCSTPLTTREKGALAGGAIGAGAGAAIGSTTGHAGTGALIGAGVGVLSGALIGDAMQANEQRQQAPPPPPPAAVPTTAPPSSQVVVVAAPPPPVVVAPPPPQGVSIDLNIGTRPQFVAVSGIPVYYAPSVSYNYFYYGKRYYLFHGEVWFSATSYNGPWTAVALERVPGPILTVPVEYYKRPPGHWKKHGPPPWAQAKGHEKKEHGKKKWEDDD